MKRLANYLIISTVILGLTTACGEMQALKSEAELKAANTERFTESRDELISALQHTGVNPDPINKVVDSVGKDVQLNQAANEKILNAIDEIRAGGSQNVVARVDRVVAAHHNDEAMKQNLKEMIVKAYQHIRTMPAAERTQLYQSLEQMLTEAKSHPNYNQHLNTATADIRNASITSEVGYQRLEFCMFGYDEYVKYSNELAAPTSFNATFDEVYNKICM